MGSGSNLLDDSHTLASIRSFLSAEKPPGIGPVDVLHIVHLLTRKAEDHEVFDSQQTLARAFSADVKTIVRSQKRLASPGVSWLSRPQRRGKTNALTLLHENLPLGEAQVPVTPEARELAGRYQIALSKHFGRKKFPKGWLPQQFVSAQRILNRCDGDLAKARKIVGHALSTKAHAGRAKHSLYHLHGRWNKIMQTYAAKAMGKDQADQPTTCESSQLDQKEAA